VSLADAVIPHDVQDAHADVVTIATTTRQTSQRQASIQTGPRVRAGASLGAGRGGVGWGSVVCLEVRLGWEKKWNKPMKLDSMPGHTDR